MKPFLDFLRDGELGAVLFLALALMALANKVAGGNEAVRRAGWVIAALAFLAFYGWGVDHVPEDSATLAFRSGCAAGLALGASWIALTILHALVHGLLVRPWRTVREWQDRAHLRRQIRRQEREDGQRQQEVSERVAEAERRRREAAANLPPPLTRDQKMLAARDRYDGTLRFLDGAELDPAELRAAQDRAKQQYLRDLDEAMR